VGDIQLQKLRTFVDMYTRQLRDYEEALDESLSEVWDATADPVALFIQPHEQAEMIQLAKTDNKIFTKVMSVFGTLCNQIRLLRETVMPPPSILFIP
jgi:WASH complex subunit 7